MKTIFKFLWLMLFLTEFPSARTTVAAESSETVFARSNLVAWCIVPFDGQKRGPEARAEMLSRLGFKRFAYDYRTEHIPTFDREIEALKKQDVELFAWWFPTSMNDEARLILDVLKRHNEHPQLWVMGGGEPTRSPEEQRARVDSEAKRIETIAVAAGKIGCKVGLYNHGGWFGEPENQIAILEKLKDRGINDVGIIYNLHHGHDHLSRFPELLQKMKPYLLALNLNGMVPEGDKIGKMILPIGQGNLDLNLLKTIRDSGWRGPIGILNHTDEDAEVRLKENLAGLERLRSELQKSELAKPEASRYWEKEDPIAREKLPLYKTIPAATAAELAPALQGTSIGGFRDWHRSHGDNGGRRFSAINHINRANVTNLEVAWTYHSGDGSGNIQCIPIIVRGKMFAPTSGGSMVALDAATGRESWRFKPDGRPAFRGLTYWPGKGDAAERILFCAGKFLYSLNPADGHPSLAFGDTGRAQLPGNAQGQFGASTAAPAVFENIIIVAGFEKDVWGFDVVTGRHLWSFHTVPHQGEFGFETWDQVESYGANCWGGIALDDVRGIAYVTTGSPKDNFIGVSHRGDNLFANCLLALDARTGRRLWHFQEIAHDIWDMDIPAAPVLATITRDGRKVDVVAAVTKAGNTLLLDRVNGKPIFPFRFRRAPVSELPGEQTAPYQPDPELPEPFSKQEFTKDDLTTRTEEAGDFAATRFKSATTGRFQPFKEGKMNLFFGVHGGAEWTGACIDPIAGRLYVSANHIPWIISVFRDDDPPDDPKIPKTKGQMLFDQLCAQCHGANRIGIGTAPPLRGLRHRMSESEIITLVHNGRNGMPAQTQLSDEELKSLADFLLIRDRPFPHIQSQTERPRYSYNGYPKFLDQEGYPASKPPWGTLNCIDLNTGKLAWKVPLGEHEELTSRGTVKTGTENFGGAIVTAGGLVFCSGTRDSRIRAFDSETGQELWSAKMPWVGSAPPATYEVAGRQFVVIAATGGGKLGTPASDAYIAFALPATPK